MNSIETPHAGTLRRANSKLERWKSAIGIGAAVAAAPVIAFVVLLLIGSVLPLLVLVTTLLVASWSHGSAEALRAAPRRAPPAPRILPAPSMA